MADRMVGMGEGFDAHIYAPRRRRSDHDSKSPAKPKSTRSMSSSAATPVGRSVSGFNASLGSRGGRSAFSDVTVCSSTSTMLPIADRSNFVAATDSTAVRALHEPDIYVHASRAMAVTGPPLIFSEESTYAETMPQTSSAFSSGGEPGSSLSQTVERDYSGSCVPFVGGLAPGRSPSSLDRRNSSSEKRGQRGSFESIPEGGSAFSVVRPVPVYGSFKDSSKGIRNVQPRSLGDKRLKMLRMQGFSVGLAKALIENGIVFDHRMWIVDNSGSMQLSDGHRIVPDKRRNRIAFKSVRCTRWEELQDTLKYHVQMAALMDSPTIFKFLNDPQPQHAPPEFGVAEDGEENYEGDIKKAMSYLRKVKPEGVTPLARHIRSFQLSVSRIAPELRRLGKKVAIVLATDGLPTDEQGYGGENVSRDFIEALRSLERLPVWVVIRLCTDEAPVTKFYNALDSQMEISVEVLDDFANEALEVQKCNRWLNYALPIHRCRELGYHDRLFDFIDERMLTKGELRDFCTLLFGVDISRQEFPDPACDWHLFLKRIHKLLKHEDDQWNPVKKKMMPWIDLKVLNKIYGDGKGCTIM